MSDPAAPWAASGQLLLNASTVLVATHVNPDGDAIGSLLALDRVLRLLGKQTHPFCPSPVPAKFTFLPGHERISPAVPAWTPDLLVILDCSDRERLAHLNKEALYMENVAPGTSRFAPVSPPARAGLGGPASPLGTGAFASIPSLNIDHHATNTRFATVNWVDPSMAATAEMLAGLVSGMGWPLDEVVATCLLTGLHTDSLGFRTATTQPRTLRLAADLMAAGASMTWIVEQLYDSKPRATLRIWGLALTALREEGPLVWTTVSREMLARAGADDEALNGIVGFMRSTADVEVAVLFSEQADGRVRVEFRSKGRVNVAEIAYRLGGGGHPPAAGCSLAGPLEAAISIALAEVRRSLSSSPIASRTE